MSVLGPDSVPLYYTCNIPGSTAPIRIRLRVVAGIQYQFDSSLRPSSGCACGILIGVTGRPGITEVTGFQPLTALDSAAVRQVVSQAPVNNILGFYRSTGRGELHISEEDVHLAKMLSNNAVILLIEADQSGVGEAALIIDNHEKLINGSVEGRFPFDAQQLAALETRRREATTEEGSGVPSWIRILERGAGRLPRTVIFAAVVMVAGAGLYFFSPVHHRVTTESVSPVRQERLPVGQFPAKSSLAFTVESRGPDLLLTWNREAAPITNASLGMMIIWSKGTIRNLTLTADQLRSGSILYKPVSDQVEFQLAVMNGDNVTQESVIALLPERDTLAASAEVRNIRSSKPKETPPPDAAPAHTVGSKLTLRLRNKGSAVVLAREPSAALALQQHPSTLGRLTESGSLFTVASGTAVNASQMESGLIKVLITEGAMAGQEGWVQAWQASTK